MVIYKHWLFQVDPGNVRLIEEGEVNALVEAEKQAEATKQAIKRKIAQAAATDFQSRSLPAKLRIEPDDPEDVVGIRVTILIFTNIFSNELQLTKSLAYDVFLLTLYPSFF